MEIQRISFNNKNKGKPGWSDRENFMCMKYTLNYEEDKNFIDEIISKAENQMKKDDKIKKIDAISGILAEKIALYFYGELAGDDNFFSKESNSSYRQINLNMTDGRTIEVRSSFVYGFPNVPLFKFLTTSNCGVNSISFFASSFFKSFHIKLNVPHQTVSSAILSSKESTTFILSAEATGALYFFPHVLNNTGLSFFILFVSIIKSVPNTIANTNKTTSNNFQTPFFIISPFPS